MTYDEQLAQRVRDMLGSGADVCEKRMFGGLAFLIDGNIAITARHRGGLMVRVDPATARRAAREHHAHQIQMRGRDMPGWLHVSASDVKTKAELARWIELAVNYTRSLPGKSS